MLELDFKERKKSGYKLDPNLEKKLQALRLEVVKSNLTNPSKTKILYGFNIDYMDGDDVKMTWSIEKTFRSFMRLENRMDSQLQTRERVPVKRFLPDISEEEGEEHLNKIHQGLEKYLKTILAIKKYRCPVLITFLGLDPYTLEPHALRSTDTFTGV